MSDRVQPFGAKRGDWPKTFPDVMFAAPLKSASSHPDYVQAKSGHADAALRLVSDIVPEGFTAQVRSALAGCRPVVVPVVAMEATGANKIPLAFAALLAWRLGLDVDAGLVQSSMVLRTGKGADHRLAIQPGFDGQVVSGQDYLLVDDTMTMGGTLANARGFIHSQGGQVVLMSALTGFGQVQPIAIAQKMRDDLWAKLLRQDARQAYDWMLKVLVANAGIPPREQAND